MIDIPDSIFPQDNNGRLLCPRCRKTIELCDCPSIELERPKTVRIKPKVFIEKSGRNGKMVTVIKNLPVSMDFLKGLSKTLKTKTGSGGTCYVEDGQGVVEIQGDHRTAVLSFFNNLDKK